MKRREFITLLGGAAALAARGARAAAGQAADHRLHGRGHAVGTGRNGSLPLCSGCANSAGSRAATVAIEYRWAEGRSERYAEIAAEFVRLKVDVIVTSGAAAVAAKQATSVIPIVFCGGGGPGRQRPGREPGATGRQRHRSVDPMSPIRVARGSNSCARLSLGCAGWRSWAMLAIPPPCSR